MIKRLNTKLSGALGFLACTSTLLTSSCSSQIEKQSQPNIILFLVDDMGWTDTSVHLGSEMTSNNRYQKTPNMELLAQQGIKFTNAYAASPVCSPTRCSILTGKNPARSQITNWIPGQGNDLHESEQKLFIPDWNINGLNAKDITIPKILKKHGYVTAHIGKAHFGKAETSGADPKNLGFDYNIAGHHAGHPASYYYPYGEENSNYKVPSLEEFEKDSLYLTDALTVKATQLIEQFSTDKKPFFLNLAHYAVHTPIQEHKELVQQFMQEGKTETEAKYASMVASMDNSLGNIMSKLNDLKIADNTIIIFMSDNGGLVTHAGHPTTNAPLSDGKGTCREGGIRVPMIVKWAGKAEAGTQCDEPVSSDDFFPTILQMAGISPNAYLSDIDGKDLTPLLTGTGSFNRPEGLCFHYPHYWAWKGLRDEYPSIKPFSSIRMGKWKLCYGYEDENVELFNLENDISERVNLVKEHPDVAKKLCSQLKSYLQKVNAQTPVDRHSGKSLPYPDIKQ
ncbi:sulfatase-like hydrolase/transferase [Marinifilum sp. N1E240]|uniref:sulfatase n=1 Tax=Marinifilum sp. N1E240 TaxID=2608082 RepID=UPI00128E77ED|nr:sulfatase [Marinifilum sp. N1E240]MPQ47205.1 sulfatase-like hydrolase/transferase [Marinifilum sp. N1E240]